MSRNLPSNALKFSEQQRKRLRNFGLIDTQIDSVEQALPLCLISLSKLPKRADVRDELQILLKALKKAQRAIERILQSKPDNPARHEVLQHVRLANQIGLDGIDSIEKANHAVSVLRNTVQHALSSLPKTQRRPNQASPFPVRRIEDALQYGFVKEHREKSPNQPLPHYVLKRSSSPASPYREIMGICYEAMGQQTTDPERAIKKHIKKCKESDQWLRSKAKRKIKIRTGGRL